MHVYALLPSSSALVSSLCFVLQMETVRLSPKKYFLEFFWLQNTFLTWAKTPFVFLRGLWAAREMVVKLDPRQGRKPRVLPRLCVWLSLIPSLPSPSLVQIPEKELSLNSLVRCVFRDRITEHRHCQSRRSVAMMIVFIKNGARSETDIFSLLGK